MRHSPFRGTTGLAIVLGVALGAAVVRGLQLKLRPRFMSW
jgi:hypothetical protein